MAGIELTRSPAAARWTGLHVSLVLLLALASKLAPSWIVARAGPPGPQPVERFDTAFVLWSAAASLLFVVATWLLLRYSSRATNADLGWQPAFWRNDVGAGVLVFLLVAVPLYGLQYLLMQIFPQQHPLLELALARRDFGFYWAGCLQAVVAAPLSEELLFRVVCQGWLADRIRALRGDSETDEGGPATPLDDSAAIAASSGAAPVCWPAILLTSLLFALLHLGQGPAPIPLFFFALVLGYLYERTRRLLPALVLHGCLNGVTMLLLGLQLLQPPA